MCLSSLSDNLKLSIDIFIMSVRHVFAEFWFTHCVTLLFKTRRQKAHHVCFLCFIKARFVDIVSAHKCDPCWQTKSVVARTNFELQAKEMKNVSFGRI